MKRLVILAALPLLISACARYDYHGVDPKIYNEVLYPKVNEVHDMKIYHSFYFDEQANSFDQSTLYEFDEFLARTHPSAAYRLQIILPTLDAQRQTYIKRLLRARGYKNASIETLKDESLASNEAIIELGYSYIVPPACPDWRKDSVTNYSNTAMSNMGCASTVNLGAQVANPRDLAGSATTRVTPDATLGNQAIQNYRAVQTAE